MARGGHRYGAGRPGWHQKAEHCLRLDVRDLAKRKLLGAGYFSWRWSDAHTGEERGSISVFGGGHELRLNFSSDSTPVAQLVPVVHTACNYGGSRPWLLCPRCSRRVAVLYLRSGRFMCRHCGRVVYASQSEDLMGRAWRRQQRLERQLERHGKGLHRKTRERIWEGILDCEDLRDRALAAYMAKHLNMFDKYGGLL
jgi:hypothetical protein